MTIKELAKELNLSFSTVSKALRDSHEISNNTKQTVLEKAKELNYQVNLLPAAYETKKPRQLQLLFQKLLMIFLAR
jgi:LacI family transcriptional regulator